MLEYKQGLTLEKEALISNIPLTVTAIVLAEFLEVYLKGGVGDNVVRVERLNKDRKFHGTAVCVFRNEAVFKRLKVLAPWLVMEGKQLEVKPGTGQSIYKREFAAEKMSFDIVKYQLGLPYHPKTDLPLVLSAQFTGKSVTKLEIDAKRAMIKVKFQLGGEDYRADFSFRRVRSCAIEVDENQQIVLSFRSQECAKLYRPPDESELTALTSGPSANHSIRSTIDLWEYGISLADGNENNWDRTTDPVENEVFKNSSNIVQIAIHKRICGDTSTNETHDSIGRGEIGIFNTFPKASLGVQLEQSDGRFLVLQWMIQTLQHVIQ